VGEYRELFARLHRRGILTLGGLMSALEEDSSEYCRELPERLDEVGVSAIPSSISIPLCGAPWYRQVVAEGRLLDKDLSSHEGDRLVLQHRRISERQAFEGYRRGGAKLW
jgi:hypothetical protein